MVNIKCHQHKPNGYTLELKLSWVGDHDNFTPNNPLVSLVHIQQELEQVFSFRYRHSPFHSQQLVRDRIGYVSCLMFGLPFMLALSSLDCTFTTYNLSAIK